ncbi:ATP-binding protein [Nocardia alba]|uniref:ATP-binding protein n=1 Tax=Nocardia alba TaxID=225051 RepID=UPI000829548F|nr:ATP-binding protein [Nocardia alba]
MKPFEVDFAADAARLAEVRHALQAWLADGSVDPDMSYDIVLAVGEACTNAVEHGHQGDGGTVTVSAALTETHVHIVVTDRGRWAAPDPDADQSRGRGLGIMRALSSEFEISTSEAGTVVDMRFALV